MSNGKNPKVGRGEFSEKMKIRGDFAAMKVSDVCLIVVTLEVDAKKLLFLLLSEDGSVNRQGSGTLGNKNPDLFIGVTDPAIFKAVRSHLTEAMLERPLGHTFEHENPRGAACKLDVRFQFRDGTSGGFMFLYGSQSQGPPSYVTTAFSGRKFCSRSSSARLRRTPPSPKTAHVCPAVPRSSPGPRPSWDRTP
jgi:hypothetical protein